jgi:hypothetical protein
MSGYWWECDKCRKQSEFQHEVGKGPVIFIWEDLVPDWDQRKLTRPCHECGGCLRITFNFPREDEEKLGVARMVGLPADPGGYLPMLWETIPASDPEKRWFHFNYMNGRSVWGLNRAAVFEKGHLRKLLDVYLEKTGHPAF